jgi:hypothetical protein
MYNPSQTAYTHRAPTNHTPIHLHIATNIHARPIFVDDAPLGQPYIHNTVQNIAIPPIPVHAFQAGSISALAYRNPARNSGVQRRNHSAAHGPPVAERRRKHIQDDIPMPSRRGLYIADKLAHGGVWSA